MGGSGWERSGGRDGRGGVGLGGVEGLLAQADPAEEQPVPLRRRRRHPGHTRSLDRSSPGRRKTRLRAHKAAAVRAAAGGLRPTSGRAAAGSNPLDLPGCSSPPTSPAHSAVSRPPASLAREPLPSTKPPLRGQSPSPLPAAASPRLLPDKKSYRSPDALGGPPWVALGWTHHSGSRRSTSRNSTCLARSDSDGGCSAFS